MDRFQSRASSADDQYAGNAASSRVVRAKTASVIAGFFLVLLLPAGLLASSGRAGFGTRASVGGATSPAEIIVRLKSTFPSPGAGISDTCLQACLRRHGLGWRRSGYGNVFHVVSVPPGVDPAVVCQRLCRDPAVAYAEPNGWFRASQAGAAVSLPNDPFLRYQWNLSEAEFGLQLPAAWQQSMGKGVIVAVLDTGVAYEDRGPYRRLPDFAGTSFVPGYDFVNDDPYANDDHRHGTHVAGVIAQATDNGLGGAGVAPGATLMPVKVLNHLAAGRDDWIASGIRFAADRGARVINMSLGGSAYSQTIQEAIEYAAAKGVLLLAAAGNQGSTLVDYPARTPQVVAVGATRFDGTRCFYSNQGPELELVAPGGDLRVDQNRDGYPDGILQQSLHEKSPALFRYRWEMGTSFAVAHASAVAALVWSLHPDWSAARVRRALRESARDLGSVGPDPAYGHGLVDAAQAVVYQPSEPDQAPRPVSATADDRAGSVSHDIRIAGVQAPRRLREGEVASVEVTVENGGDAPETVTISLTDLTAGVAPAPKQVTLLPGTSATVSFDVTAAAPLGTHFWLLRALAVGGTDGRPADNEQTMEVTVEKGVLQLLLSPGKPTYRRGERVLLSLTASEPGGPAIRLRVRLAVFDDADQMVFRWTLITNTKGQGAVTLPGTLGRSGPGVFRAEAIAEPGDGPPTRAAVTFEVVP